MKTIDNGGTLATMELNSSTVEQISMAIITVKKKYQVVIPQSIRREIRMNVGDVVEMRVERGTITLTPKSVVDRAIAEGLEDVRKGRFHGPFETHKEMIAYLHDAVRRSKAKTKKLKTR
jgi:AbrB family looped-hinge helix DNA binding protein